MAKEIINEAGMTDLLGDLESSLDSMRVFCDVMTSQLMEHLPSNAASSMALNERMHVLVRSLLKEIDCAQNLHQALSGA
jgi:hypothetical protein